MEWNPWSMVIPGQWYGKIRIGPSPLHEEYYSLAAYYTLEANSIDTHPMKYTLLHSVGQDWNPHSMSLKPKSSDEAPRPRSMSLSSGCYNY